MATHELRITIRDGRYMPFPPPNHTGVIVRATFGSKTLATQSVKDIAHAEWKEDLVFPLTAAELRRLKGMKAPIKVEMWTPSDRDPSKGVVLGHVLLDIRTAEQHYVQRNNTTPMVKPNAPTVRTGGKWYPLLRSSERQPPELRMYYVLAPRSGASRFGTQTTPHAKGKVPKQHQPTPLPHSHPDDVEDQDIAESPVFRKAMAGPRAAPVSQVSLATDQHEQAEILQIGNGLTSFSLIASFHGGFNLADYDLGHGLQLQIDLLGTRARTAVFHGEDDIVSSIGDGDASWIFNGEFGTTIHILSSDAELATLWASPAHRPNIEVAVIALSPHASDGLDAEEEEEAEGEVTVATAIIDTTRLSLRTPVRFRAELLSVDNEDEDVDNGNANGNAEASIDGQISLACTNQAQGQAQSQYSSPEKGKHMDMGMGMDDSKTLGAGRLGYGSSSTAAQNISRFGGDAHAHVPETSNGNTDEPIHHWRFGIDLHAIRDLHLQLGDDNDEDADVLDQLAVYLRYAYPMFGSPVPISTDPPIIIKLNEDGVGEGEGESDGDEHNNSGDSLLPSSFCLFEFAATLSELANGLASEPLKLLAFNRGAPPVGEACFAQAEVWLSRVLESPDLLENEGDVKDKDKDRNVNANAKKPRSLQCLDSYIPLFSIPDSLKLNSKHPSGDEEEEEKKKESSDGYACGYVRVIMSLEDMGLLKIPQSQRELDAHRNEMEQRRANTEWVGAGAGNCTGAAPGVSAKEYAAAWELEMWKKSETLRFQKQLETKERKYMSAIAEEWKRREYTRQQEVDRRMQLLTRLEEKARSTLADVEKREKSTRDAQHLLSRAQAVMKEEQDRAKQTVKDEVRRVREEATHKAELAKGRQVESDRIIKSLRNRCADLERRHNELEETLAKQRRTQLTQGPRHLGKGKDVDGEEDKEKQKLRARIEELTAQLADARVGLAESETKLEHSEAAKSRALSELGAAVSAVRELKRQKKNLESAKFAEEKAQIDAERTALEDARLHAAANHEQQQLEEIKTTLSKLKMQEARLAVVSGFDTEIDMNGGAENHNQQYTEVLPLDLPEVHRRIHFPVRGEGEGVDGSGQEEKEMGQGQEKENVDNNNSNIDAGDLRGLIDNATSDHLLRWRQERDSLLGTGVYQLTDPIVKRLTMLIDGAELRGL